MTTTEIAASDPSLTTGIRVVTLAPRSTSDRKAPHCVHELAPPELKERTRLLQLQGGGPLRHKKEYEEEECDTDEEGVEEYDEDGKPHTCYSLSGTIGKDEADINADNVQIEGYGDFVLDGSGDESGDGSGDESGDGSGEKELVDSLTVLIGRHIVYADDMPTSHVGNTSMSAMLATIPASAHQANMAQVLPEERQDALKGTLCECWKCQKLPEPNGSDHECTLSEEIMCTDERLQSRQQGVRDLLDEYQIATDYTKNPDTYMKARWQSIVLFVNQSNRLKNLNTNYRTLMSTSAPATENLHQLQLMEGLKRENPRATFADAAIVMQQAKVKQDGAMLEILSEAYEESREKCSEYAVDNQIGRMINSIESAIQTLLTNSVVGMVKSATVFRFEQQDDLQAVMSNCATQVKNRKPPDAKDAVGRLASLVKCLDDARSAWNEDLKKAQALVNELECWDDLNFLKDAKTGRLKCAPMKHTNNVHKLLVMLVQYLKPIFADSGTSAQPAVIDLCTPFKTVKDEKVAVSFMALAAEKQVASLDSVSRLMELFKPDGSFGCLHTSLLSKIPDKEMVLPLLSDPQTMPMWREIIVELRSTAKTSLSAAVKNMQQLFNKTDQVKYRDQLALRNRLEKLINSCKSILSTKKESPTAMASMAEPPAAGADPYATESDDDERPSKRSRTCGCSVGNCICKSTSE